MHIEVWQTVGSEKWYWHFKNKGRITANAESFPSRGNAMRAAKGVVTAISKHLEVPGIGGPPSVEFTTRIVHGITRIDWR